MAQGSERGKGDCNFPLVPMASDKIIVLQAGVCEVSATSPASGDDEEGRGERKERGGVGWGGRKREREREREDSKV